MAGEIGGLRYPRRHWKGKSGASAVVGHFERVVLHERHAVEESGADTAATFRSCFRSWARSTVPCRRHRVRARPE